MADSLNLGRDWDKTFPLSPAVEHSKAVFRNRFGIELAADVYVPKGASGRLPAIAVCGPFGAVKEQASGLYAQAMAERGFLTLAFDPSFTGESGGEPRYVASPDINTEDFQAAVDYLSVREDVEPERIGIIGICGWGGLALNAAAADTRIKGCAGIYIGLGCQFGLVQGKLGTWSLPDTSQFFVALGIYKACLEIHLCGHAGCQYGFCVSFQSGVEQNVGVDIYDHRDGAYHELEVIAFGS